MVKIAMAMLGWSTRGQRIAEAAFDYAKTLPTWNVIPFDAVPPYRVLQRVSRWNADGLIVCLEGEYAPWYDDVAALKIPVVNVGVARGAIPQVIVDPRSIADLAVEHFCDNGVQSIAYAASADRADVRQELARRTAGAGFTFSQFTADWHFDRLIDSSSVPDGSLQQWLRGVEMPVGVVASSDFLASHLRVVAEHLGYVVPDQIGIISERDSPLCESEHSSLTAIRVSEEEIGFQAMRLLGRVLKGKPAPARSVLVAADEIVVRTSTRQLEIHPTVARAVHFIQENACRGISVSDVAASQEVLRVTLERRFREAIHRTPGEEIRRVRLEQAIEHLLGTDLSITRVGELCGFDAVTHFSTFFKTAMGMSPQKYRMEQQQA